MRRVKTTTVVFLAQLAISNLFQGLLFFISALIYLCHAFDGIGCLMWVFLTQVGSGSYVTGILFIYLDLCLSLRSMSVGKPVISTRKAVAMACASWLVWLSWGVVGFGMLNTKYTYDNEEGCLMVSGLYRKEYILITAMYFIIIFIVILVFHVLSYHELTKSRKELLRIQNVEVGNVNRPEGQTVPDDDRRSDNGREDAKKKVKWLKKNEVVLRTITLILVMLIIGWYPVIITSVIVVYCDRCAAIITKQIIYVTYVLVAIQYNSNGVIYLIKIKEFQQALRDLCHGCHSSQRRVGSDVTVNVRTIA